MHRLAHLSQRSARTLVTSATSALRGAAACAIARAACPYAVPCQPSIVVSVSTCIPRYFSSAPPSSDANLQQWQSFNSAGLQFLSEGKYEQASVLFMSAMRESAVQRTMYQYLSLSNLGVSFRHLKRYGEAKDVLLQATAQLKGYSQIHDAMLANLHREAALCCEAMEQTKEAEDLMHSALFLYAQYALAREQSGAAAHASPAEQQEMRKIAMEQAATHYSLALILHRAGLAARDAQEAASGAVITPAQRVAHAQPQQLREALRHYHSALQQVRALHGSDPKSAGALLTAPMLASYGALQNDLGDSETAKETLLEALDIYKEHNDPRLLPLLDSYMAILQQSNPAMQQLFEQTQTQAQASKPQ